MKLFGTFLLENGLITEGQLLDALVSQVEAVPSVAKIVLDRGLMSKQDQLKVMSHQALNRCEFVAACRALGLWGETIEASVIDSVARAREPIGATLVRQQIITQQQLDNQLSSFLERHSHQFEAVVKAEVVSAHMDVSAPAVLEPVHQAEHIQMATVDDGHDDVPVQTAESTFRFEPNFGHSAPSPHLLKEFLSVFTVERFESLQQSLKISVVPKPTSGSISHVIEEIAMIGASVRFLRLPLMSRICDEVESFIGEVGVVESWSSAVVDLISDAIGIMWSIRRELSADRSEEQMWQDSEFKEVYLRSIAQIISHLEMKKVA
jgi:hypothetical protein